MCSNEYLLQSKGMRPLKTTKTGTTIVGLCYKVRWVAPEGETPM